MQSPELEHHRDSYILESAVCPRIRELSSNYPEMLTYLYEANHLANSRADKVFLLHSFLTKKRQCHLAPKYAHLQPMLKRPQLTQLLQSFDGLLDVKLSAEGCAPIIKCLTVIDEESARALLEAGASVNARDDQGNSALAIALHFCQHNFVIDALLKTDCMINDDMPDGTPIINKIVTFRRYNCFLPNILCRISDIDIQDPKGRTPLICAIASCNEAAVDALLDAGAHFDTRLTDLSRWQESCRKFVQRAADYSMDDSHKLSINTCPAFVNSLVGSALPYRQRIINHIMQKLERVFKKNSVDLLSRSVVRSITIAALAACKNMQDSYASEESALAYPAVQAQASQQPSQAGSSSHHAYTTVPRIKPIAIKALPARTDTGELLTVYRVMQKGNFVHSGSSLFK